MITDMPMADAMIPAGRGLLTTSVTGAPGQASDVHKAVTMQALILE